MGKYMRKSKAVGDVAALQMAVQSSSLGVRTRAKTLALQQSVSGGGGGGSYLQLRSRKLEKPPLAAAGLRQRQRRSVMQNPSPNFKTRASSRLRVSSSTVVENQQVESGSEKLKDGGEIGEAGVDGVGDCEAFFGENSPDFHGRERSTRESTPCSFIRDPDHAGTPGSTSKPSSSVENSKRMQNSACNRLMPTAKEMEEFFAGAEQQQHRQFIEKYNFNPVNEKPLSGRYDWEKIDPQQDTPAPPF